MYRWVEHTGELELEIQCPDERSVFAEAAVAFRELIEQDGREAEQSHQLEVEAPDRATLLAEYLGELVFLAETEDFVPVRLDPLELGRDRLSATVHGYRGRPPHLVKAVTYHRLAFDRAGEGWHARVVLDV